MMNEVSLVEIENGVCTEIGRLLVSFLPDVNNLVRLNDKSYKILNVQIKTSYYTMGLHKVDEIVAIVEKNGK